MLSSLAQLKKALLQTPPSLLILSKEKSEQEAALALALSPNARIFDRESFDSQAFMREFESASFLHNKRMLVVREIEKLSASGIAVLLRAAERPFLDCQLVFVGESAPPKLSKAVTVTVKMPVKRPFEREGDLAHHLVSKAQQLGVHLPLDVARIWVKSFGGEQALLEQELEKMACYVGDGGEITLRSVREFSIALPHLTLWQLGDALFSCSRTEAWKVLHALLEEGVVVFQILSHLRTQFETGKRILNAHKRGTLVEEFPYLKGGLGQKKVSLLSNFGWERLERGLILFFEAEVRAKSQTLSPELLLEPLMIRLTA